MPTKGFRTITVGQDTYAFAERMSNQENVSISRLISDALESYFSKRLSTKEKVRIIAEVLDEREAKETK
jgi:hypothetical protein